jgi:flavin-binding protein dodecin
MPCAASDYPRNESKGSVEDTAGADAGREEPAMTDHVYRVTEIVGTSPDGVDAAIRNGLARAGQTLHNLDWFEVVSVRGHLEDGEIHHFQVTLKVGFRLDE